MGDLQTRNLETGDLKTRDLIKENELQLQLEILRTIICASWKQHNDRKIDVTNHTWRLEAGLVQKVAA